MCMSDQRPLAKTTVVVQYISRGTGGILPDATPVKWQGLKIACRFSSSFCGEDICEKRSIT